MGAGPVKHWEQTGVTHPGSLRCPGGVEGAVLDTTKPYWALKFWVLCRFWELEVCCVASPSCLCTPVLCLVCRDFCLR